MTNTKTNLLLAYLCLLLPFTIYSQNDYQLNIQKASEKIKIDGKLDENSWKNAAIASDFWMAFPVDGKKADLQTEVRMTYDEQFLYLSAVCHGDDQYIIQTLKRDVDFWESDVFVVVIDPVNQRSNGFNFGVNPFNVQMDATIAGQIDSRASLSGGPPSGVNSSWDNKWYSSVSNHSDRWIVEIAIPFKTLRYDASKDTWGINFVRGDIKKNSFHTWAPVPVQWLTVDLGYTGTLHWDKPPKAQKRNISLIPYVTGSYDKDFQNNKAANWTPDVGVDAKIAVTSSLNLDLTVNPDFSQVEVDQQVTNLTTFNIQFPERRLFFLENSDIFSEFGVPPIRPFFSRRIGLDQSGNAIPILYGLRLSGNLDKNLRMGLMNMHTRSTDDFLAQNYTAAALERRVWSRSSIKGFFLNRQSFDDGEVLSSDYGRNAGLEFDYSTPDGKWGGFAHYHHSFKKDINDKNYYFNVGFRHNSRNISVFIDHNRMADNYTADMGFIPFISNYDAARDTVIRQAVSASFNRFTYTHFPKNNDRINSVQFQVTDQYKLDKDWKFRDNTVTLSTKINYANKSRLTFLATQNNVRLLFPFTFTKSTPLPAQWYDYRTAQVRYQSNNRKSFNFNTSLLYGGFYNGTRFETVLQLNYRVQPWGNFGLSVAQNDLDFPDEYGSTRLWLIGPRIEINFSNNLFWTTFIQYNTQADNLNINSRLQWRFQPMSDFYLVYTDNYAVDVWGKKNRALVLKASYWLNL
jgi:hypothetical protein